VASGQLAGWSAAHGHVTLNGTVPPHHHPWNRPASDAPAAQSEEVAFTLSDTGVVDFAFAVVLPSDGWHSLGRSDVPHFVPFAPLKVPASAHVDVPEPRLRA